MSNIKAHTLSFFKLFLSVEYPKEVLLKGQDNKQEFSLPYNLQDPEKSFQNMQKLVLGHAKLTAELADLKLKSGEESHVLSTSILFLRLLGQTFLDIGIP